MSGSKKSVAMTVDDLAEAIELFATHLLDAVTDLHVVVGPILWRPSADDLARKQWYFIVAVCDSDGFRCELLSTGHDQDLVLEARALTMMMLVERRPRVVHDVGGELEMARLVEVLWPSPRTRALRAAVEREQASQ